MELYYYCSYEGSPCGFGLGKLDLDGAAPQGLMTLSDGSAEPLIRRCYDYGNVRSAIGPLLKGPRRRWFLLIKHLDCESPDGTAFYMNIALVTENEQQYSCWKMKGEPKEKIAELCRQTMVIDRASKYGFKVDGSRLEELLGCRFGSLFASAPPDSTDKGPFFELSPGADPEDTARKLGFADSTLVHKQGYGNWVCVKKKTSRSLREILRTILKALRKIAPLLAVLALILAAVLLIRAFRGKMV